MSRTSQESSTAFGEVLRSASQNYSNNPQGRIVSNDNQLMIYSQGMKYMCQKTLIQVHF